MTEEEIFREACEECNLTYNSECTKMIMEEELAEVEEVYQKTEDERQDCESDIRNLKAEYEEAVQRKHDRISEMNQLDESNWKFRDQRQSVLRQVEVIEYRLLNPGMEIN